MEHKKIFDEEELKILPISFQFFIDKFDMIETIKIKPKHISVEKYKTDCYSPDRFYKPISQLLSK
jgi:hypothetical protein